MPAFVYSLKFWEALSLILAVAAVQLGLVEAVDAAKILGVFLAILSLVGVEPELRAKKLL